VAQEAFISVLDGLQDYFKTASPAAPPDIQLARLAMVGEVELNHLVKEFREALQNPRVDPLPLAQKLYNILVKPLEQDLLQQNAKTLMWSLDGTLRYVPLAALHDGKQYFIERYPLVLYTAAANNKLLHDDNSSWKLAELGVSKQYGNFSALEAVPGELNSIIKEDSSDEDGVIPGNGIAEYFFPVVIDKTILTQHWPLA
jgi:CHAT domain-containing protein